MLCLLHFNDPGMWSEHTTDSFWLTDQRSSPLPGCVSEVCASPPPPPPHYLYSLCLAGGGRRWVECGKDGAIPPSWRWLALHCRSGPGTQRRWVPEDRFPRLHCSVQEPCGSSSLQSFSASLPLPRPLRPGRHRRKWCWWFFFSSCALSSAQSLVKTGVHFTTFCPKRIFCIFTAAMTSFSSMGPTGSHNIWLAVIENNIC